MRSHDLAKALRQLAKILETGPNTALTQVRIKPTTDDSLRTSGDIAVNVSTLVALSRLGKQQWLNFIAEYDLPISTRPRDAARDILGKVLRHLEMNPADRTKIKRKATSFSSEGTSPELVDALRTLMRD